MFYVNDRITKTKKDVSFRKRDSLNSFMEAFSACLGLVVFK